MKITVVGADYDGLITATTLAYVGHHVMCVDSDKEKVAHILNGQLMVHEPGLEEIFKHVLDNYHLDAADNLSEGVKDADVIFLALPVPSDTSGSADLSGLLGVADELGPLLSRYTIVVNRSTVPVGTGETVRSRIASNTSQEFDVISNPGFYRKGMAVEDSMHPDRIVIGASNLKAREMIEKVYAPFIDRPGQIIHMDVRSAEMTKYAANAFLAMKASFMNEMANLCDTMDVNVDYIRLGIGPDMRIGRKFLGAGIGFGGSALHDDARTLSHMAEQHSSDFQMLSSAMNVNKNQSRQLFDKVNTYYGKDLSGKHFGVWGLAYKPDTDDIREAPSLELVELLLKAGASVAVYDPKALQNARVHFGDRWGLLYASTSLNALVGADALIIATEWDEFRSPDFAKLREMLKQPVIFDGRNMYQLEYMQENDFQYLSMGRPDVRHEHIRAGKV